MPYTQASVKIYTKELAINVIYYRCDQLTLSLKEEPADRRLSRTC
jgi:hypothetical protein